MTAVPRLRPAPLRWPAALLHMSVRDGALRDSILGDLQEEFLVDAGRVGPTLARLRHARRALGIVAYATFDSLRWRACESAETPRERSAASAPIERSLAARARARRAGVGAGLALAAFVLLAIGIVASTMLFSAVHPASIAATRERPAASPMLGIGAVAFALGCVSVAAVVLCAGPRWLRKRIHGT